MTVRVKICGITNVLDALAAAEAGADAIGLNFSTGPRKITPAVAREIVAELPPFVTPVALFVDAPVDEMRQICDACGISTVQLHGDEGPEVLEALAPRRVIKAFRVATPDDLATIGAFCDACAETGRPAAVLLDARAAGKHGGTGRTFDWSLARQAGAVERVVLAGGLTAENVGEAVRVARPYAVDACSKLEIEPGKKDRAKMAAFIAAAHAAEIGSENGNLKSQI